MGDVLELTKPIFKQNLERLERTFEEIATPSFYHYHPHNLGYVNGLMTAVAILKGRDVREISYIPPPKTWGYEDERKENHEGKNHGNNQRERGQCDSSEHNAPQEHHVEDHQSDAQRDSGDANRSQSCGSSEETCDEQKVGEQGSSSDSSSVSEKVGA